MIQTVAELLAWLPEEQARHQRMGDDLRCSCGWQADPLPPLEVTQAHHTEVVILSALLDHLPSNTWGIDGEQVPAGKLIPDLYAALDQRHEDEGKLVQAIEEIARGTDDPKGRARAALNAWHYDEA